MKLSDWNGGRCLTYNSISNDEGVIFASKATFAQFQKDCGLGRQGGRGDSFFLRKLMTKHGFRV